MNENERERRRQICRPRNKPSDRKKTAEEHAIEQKWIAGEISTEEFNAFFTVMLEGWRKADMERNP